MYGPALADVKKAFDGAGLFHVEIFIALAGRQAEIWMVRRDGSALSQLTSNDRAEASLAWSPDGSALLYGSS